MREGTASFLSRAAVLTAHLKRFAPLRDHNFSTIFPQLSHDFFAVGAYPLFRSQMARFDEEDCHDGFWFLSHR